MRSPPFLLDCAADPACFVCVHAAKRGASVTCFGMTHKRPNFVLMPDGTTLSRGEYRLTLLAQDPHCFYCGAALTKETSSLDHYVPHSLGGPTTPANLRLACEPCQRRKADIPIECLVLPRVAGQPLLRVWELPLFVKGSVMSEKIVGFNYASLEGTARDTAKANAKEINTLLRKTAEAAVEIGRRLHAVYAAVGSMSFGAWLKAEFRWSQSVASKFMCMAARFGELDCLSKFQPSALYVLAREKTDERAVAAAIAAARAGETITHKRAVAFCRQFETETAVAPSARRTAAVSATPTAPADVFTLVRTSVRELHEHFADVSGRLTPAEASELADELLRLALELRTTASAAAPARSTKPVRTAPVSTKPPRKRDAGPSAVASMLHEVSARVSAGS